MLVRNDSDRGSGLPALPFISALTSALRRGQDALGRADVCSRNYLNDAARPTSGPDRRSRVPAEFVLGDRIARG